MTRDYSKGKIYKIEPIIDHDEGEIYIGSTTKEYLSQRMVNHRSQYKRFQNGIKNKINSFSLFNKYGIENCQIILIENVDAISKDELMSREAFYIRTMKCVNKNVPLRTKKELIETNKILIESNEEMVECKEKTKEQLQNREYYDKNKDIILQTRKEYREIHKEEIKERDKKYKCERIICSCGCNVRRGDLKRHERTINHLLKINVTI